MSEATTLTYKYRLKGRRAARMLRRMAWGVNQVWNYCAEVQRIAQRLWKEGGNGRWPRPFALDALTRGVASELGIHSGTATLVSVRFARSRDQHKVCPRFRRSGGARRSLGWVPFKAKERYLVGDNTIRHLGHAFRWFGSKRRPLPPNVRDGAFVEDASGRWWVCLAVEIEDERATGSGEVGIDLGLKHLAVMSDGEKIGEQLPAGRRQPAGAHR